MNFIELIAAYRSDVDSPYVKKKLRYATRCHYDVLADVVARDFGAKPLSEIKARDILHWNEDFISRGNIAMGHAVVGMMRTLCSFGKTMLEDAQCERLSGILSDMRFTMAKPRVERLTAEHATLIRRKAYEIGRPSIALAQALQFDGMFRQKDVIGEWVPDDEPGASDVEKIRDGLRMKWMRGIRWEEIDDKFVLKHITSKRQKEVVLNLTLAPMILEELHYAMGQNAVGGLQRSKFPETGPVIFCEATELPWVAQEFRRQWRVCARLCGVPDSVRNMDSRAGAITEATQAGADLESIRHAATHSDIQMTQKYARASEEKTEKVLLMRAAHRLRS